MALTVVNVRTGAPPGNLKEAVKEITFDSSYAEKGESLTLKELGLKKVIFSTCHVINGSEAEANPVNTARYSTTEQTVQLIDGKTSKEMAKEKDMSKVKVLLIARGF